MAQGFNIGTEAGVRVQTPTRGLVLYLKEIVPPDYIDYGGETQIGGAWPTAQGSVKLSDGASGPEDLS